MATVTLRDLYAAELHDLMNAEKQIVAELPIMAGRAMMAALLDKYAGFHQQMLTADGDAVAFYESLGFACAGRTQSMWIYAGTEH